MVDENYNLKLIDFGEAKNVNGPEEIEEESKEPEVKKKKMKKREPKEEDDTFDFGEEEEEEEDEEEKLFGENDAHQQRHDTFVGTYNYLSPEVIKREKHTVAIDIWALGLIYFKMRIGKPAFPGQSEVELEKKILDRAIKWPSEYLKPDHANFDDDEKDLVDKLCQLEPKDRLGGTKETMPDLKAHPAFKDIDWVKISSPDFTDARELMDELIKYETDFQEKGAGPFIVPKPKPILPRDDDV
jgi:serine/threonine protein kinase